MRTQLYKNTSGQWIFDGGSMPSGSCYERYRNGTVRIYLLNQAILFEGKVSDLLRGDGTPYENYAVFKSECGDFFVNPLNPLKEDVEGLKLNKADLVEGKVPDEQLPETTFPTIAVENMERTIAESLLILQSRIQALEGLLAAGVYGSVQAETISAVSSLQFKGAELILQGAGAPTLVPDFIGQIYIKTDATVAVYIATGVATSGDWKSV